MMKYNKISKVTLSVLFIIYTLFGFFSAFTLATDFQIIPAPRDDSQTKIQNAINAVNNVYNTSDGNKKTDLRTEYNQWAKSLDGDLWAQIKTGMFTWESLLNIATYVIRFLMQIAMVIWAGFIIRWWYQSVMVAFGSGSADNWRKYIKNIFVWVVIIAFAYTIIQLLTMAFLS